MEEWQSGRLRQSWKLLTVTGPGVRIPVPPLTKEKPTGNSRFFRFICFPLSWVSHWTIPISFEFFSYRPFPAFHFAIRVGLQYYNILLEPQPSERLNICKKLTGASKFRIIFLGAFIRLPLQSFCSALLHKKDFRSSRGAGAFSETLPVTAK